MTSAALARTTTPEPPNPDGIQSAPEAFERGRTPGDAIQDYDQCPAGRACVFEGWNGTGTWLYMIRCGWVDLNPYQNIVSSAKTHGNAMWLYDTNSGQYVGYIPPWTQTNLSAAENDRADYVYVVC
jgi:peptidase inhibitor family I36